MSVVSPRIWVVARRSSAGRSVATRPRRAATAWCLPMFKSSVRVAGLRSARSRPTRCCVPVCWLTWDVHAPCGRSRASGGLGPHCGHHGPFRPAGCAQASHEAIYRFIHARPEYVADRRGPGAWEGDLIIGAHGKSAAATLVERTTRLTLICALPEGKQAPAVADALTEHLTAFPEMARTSLTWDQGSEMAEHARLTIAANLPVYFAHPRSPWERGTNENTNGLIREHLPQGHIHHQQPGLPHLDRRRAQRPPPGVTGVLHPQREVRRTPHGQRCFDALTPPIADITGRFAGHLPLGLPTHPCYGLRGWPDWPTTGPMAGTTDRGRE